MWEAAAWGALAAATLLVGMSVALVWQVPQRVVGLILGVGSGALFGAIAFELVATTLELGSERVLAGGMLTGAFVYIAGDRLIAGHPGGTNASRSGDEREAKAIILGAGLDGIPESIAIGGSLAAAGAVSQHVSVALVGAVALSNFPEGLAATTQLRAAGHRVSRIVLVWGTLVLISALSALVGYLALSSVDVVASAALAAFAAGAVLAMLADTMVPMAYRDGGEWVGLASVVGFVLALLIG